MFKKILMAIIVGTTVFSSVTVASAEPSLPEVRKPSLAIDLIVDGKKVTLPDIEPYIDDAGNTMVPIRFVSEKLGADVKWDNAKQIVTITHKGNTIVMPVGSKNVTVNGNTTTLDAMAIKKEGRVVVPLRFVSETLESSVTYDSGYGGINMTSSSYQEKLDSGTVTLDRWGRELRPNQSSKEWNLMSDTPNNVYSIKKYMIYHMDGEIVAKDYSKRFTKEDLDRIAKNVKEYYKLALNIDYRTMNPTSYFNKSFDLLGHNGYMDREPFDQFVKYMQNNKVIVEGYAFPDTSAIYSYHGTQFIRTKFKFRVLSANDYTQFNADSYKPGNKSDKVTWVKKGQWYETYSDVSLFTNSQDIQGTLKIGSTGNMFTKGAYLYKELK
ncbi:copper amine oxidase N-terminal domain-containing protein [Paenibacillus sp. MER 180]|uniref:copper amine oxidase N-terminal domain-containing protein n=1 Tax=Paenibacillus sp. MER 180 TaxID=2939570 RepID=UPI00203C98E7|nr:copper amine oxidase N-terminal domain-containing protein [Paenibacillus sp. MER 180]MCM3293160.1 copper amine oxidase N-terminal domain-containing protein [Paenibacillus sp. MER 180]